MGNAQAGTLTGNPNSWGACLISIDAGNNFWVNASYQNLGSAWNGAHVHGPAALGVDGPPKIFMQNTDASSNVAPGRPNSGFLWGGPTNGPTYAALNISELAAFKYYCNIHSATNAAGEVRGQLYPSTNWYMAACDGLQADTASNGTCNAWCTLTQPNTFTCTVNYWGLTGNVTAAHVHGPAGVGVSGAGVLLNLDPTTGLRAGSMTASSTSFGVTDIVRVRSDLTYVNIHTTYNGAGEIRGQLRMVNSLMSAAATTGQFSAACQPWGSYYRQQCLRGTGDGLWTLSYATYSDAGCTTIVSAGSVTHNLFNLGTSLTWPGVDKFKTWVADSVTYGVSDVTNANLLPTGCTCGGGWANYQARTVTRAECGSSCSLFDAMYFQGVFNSTGLYTSPQRATATAAWADTQLSGIRYGGLSNTACPSFPASLVAPNAAPNAAHASLLTAAAVAIVALTAARRLF